MRERSKISNPNSFFAMARKEAPPTKKASLSHAVKSQNKRSRIHYKLPVTCRESARCQYGCHMRESVEQATVIRTSMDVASS
jgi:hypothetical protein